MKCTMIGGFSREICKDHSLLSTTLKRAIGLPQSSSTLQPYGPGPSENVRIAADCADRELPPPQPVPQQGHMCYSLNS